MERGDEMIDLEQRLQDAADEIRRTTTAFDPPPLPGPRHVWRGWAMAAGAFALVVALGLIPLLSPRAGDVGSGSTPDITPATTVGVTPTTLAPDTTLPVAATCSATGMDMPAPQPGLPRAVAETRDELAAAAIACDYARLEALTSEDFITSFGGGGFENIETWEDEGQAPLEMIVLLLDTPYGTQEPEEMDPIYAWPAAFTYDTWEEVPQDQKDELATIYDAEEIDLIETFGAYALWRIGITESGQWRFYVAGD
jgi:hypothetical protein